MQLGNKIEVVKKVLEVVTYIEDSQNSPDMQVYKDMLVKISGTILNTLRDEGVGQTLNDPSDVVQCDVNGCDGCGDTEVNNDVQFTIQKTIDDIRTEIKEGK